MEPIMDWKIVNFFYFLVIFGCVYGFPKRVLKEKKSLIGPENLYVAHIGNKPRLPHNLVVNQYDITIQPYFDAPGVTYPNGRNQTFDGNVRIQFKMTAYAQSISLDVYNMSIIRASLFRGTIRQQLVSAGYDSNANRYTLSPVYFLQPNVDYSIEMNYTGNIFDYDHGGLFSSVYAFPNGTWGAVYATHFETFPDQYSHYDPVIGSARLFPCFDDPHFKSYFNLTLIYPKSLTAIANTLDASTNDYGNGWQITNFKLTQHQSSYLLAFGIGDLVSKTATMPDGFLVRAYSWRGTENFLDNAVSQTTTCVDVMTKFTGMKLPFEKLDLLAVPFFSAGGMENWGLIINAAEFVLVNPDEDTIYTSVTGTDVNCHEIAHQWFGDYVTNDWWSDIMLHESFAAYFEDYTIVNGWPNQAEFWDAYWLYASFNSGFNSDLYYQTPIVVDPNNVHRAFDTPVYDKGSALLRMLSATLSPTLFQQGLQNYLQKYKFSTATHKDLFAVITDVAIQNNLTDWCRRPLNVTKFMDPWFEQPHFPVLKVVYDEPSNSYFVDQQPFMGYANLDNKYSYNWAVPFHVKQIGSGGVQLYWSAPSYPCFGTEKITTSNSPAGVKIPSTSDGPILINFDSTAFARVEYDDYSFQKIIDSLNSKQNAYADNTLVRLISDEYAIFQRNRNLGQMASYLRTLKMTAAALMNTGTNSVGVFLTAQQIIDEMISLGMDSYEYDLFNKYFTTILTPLYTTTGWKQNATENWNLDIFQQIMLPYAVRFDIGDARAQALVYFSNLMSKCQTDPDFVKCNNVPKPIRTAVYCGAAIKGNIDTFMVLTGFLRSARTTYSFRNAEVKALVTGMACAQDQVSLTRYFNFAFSGGNLQPSDLMVLTSNPKAADALYDFVLNNFLTVTTLTDGLEYALGAITANWITPARAQQIQKLKDQLADQLDNKSKQLFDDAITSINIRSPTAMSDRAEIIRHFYDYYAPIGAIPWPKQLPQGMVKPISYDLTVQPYIPNKSYVYLAEKNFTYDGTVTVLFQALQNLQSIVLNSHRQVLASVIVTLPNQTNAQVPVTAVTRDYDHAFMTLTLGSTIQAGQFVQIVFTYSGFIFEDTPNEGDLSNYDYLKSDGRKSWIFATDFEGGPSTRSLAICFDEPSYKAIWQVSIIYPGEFTALSNTLEESVTNLKNGLVKTVFKKTNPMSSYLLALTIGHYSCVQSVSNVDKTLVRIWTWTGMEQYGQNALQFAIATVDYLSKTLNTPMPLEKFDVLALPQYSGSAYGAMENWGLVIAGYREVLFHPDYSFTEELAEIQDVVSHELTHHWFGDLVTMDWWTHLFLNEGFATFWPPRTLNATLPEQGNIAKQRIFAIHETGIRFDDNANSAHPVVPSNELFNNPNYNTFGVAVYYKAASIIATLRNVFGNDTAFYQGLSQYQQSHALSNSDDLGLWKSMNWVAQQIKTKDWMNSILNSTKMMLPLTYQWSAPEISVTSNGMNGFTLTQNPLAPRDSLPTSDYNYQWIVPFKTLSPGPVKSTVQWVYNSISSLPYSNPTPILNPEAETHARVLYDDASWASIYTTLKQNLTSIDEVTRAMLLADSWAFVDAGKISWQRFMDLTSYLSNENGYVPWKYALSPSSFVQNFIKRFRFQPIQPSLKTYLTRISSSLKLGNFVNGNDWSQNMLNASLLDLRCYLGDQNCLSSAVNNFNQFVTQCQYAATGTGPCNPVSPEYRATQFCYGLRQNPGSLAVLTKLANWWLNNPESNSYFPQDYESIIFGISCYNDGTGLNDLITQTLNKQFPSFLLENIGQNDVSGNILFNYLQSNPTKIMNSDMFDYFISSMTTDWSTDAQLNSIQSFAWPTKLTASQQQSVNNAIQKITNLRTWLTTNGVVISNWINNFVNSS